MKISAQELRGRYLDFFKSHEHAVISSASLVPENDPTVLFTTAGMHPLVPYLLGEKHPGGKRVTSVQKCVRTDDIDEVGDTTHHTFFEMLGNWSFGDYFKEDAIKMSWDFLTSNKWLNIDKNRLAVSVFEGDADAPLDEESKKIWLALGVPEKRIAALPKKHNWWGPAGQTGPCGPDTEMFYWVGNSTPPNQFNPDDKHWVEIWNDVFMQYNKQADGTFAPLAQQNVDTGMGLERTLAVLNGYDDNYKTDLFWPIIEKIQELSGKKYEGNEKGMRIIADHVRASVFIAADGVNPSNTERGYVLRRLLRRAIRYGHMIGIRHNFIVDLANVVIFMEVCRHYGLISVRRRIQEAFAQEEGKFGNALEIGLKELQNEIEGFKALGEYETPSATNEINAQMAFNIYQTFGFPLEMIQEELEKENLFVDENKFKQEVKKHAVLSRTASAGTFKGGLADQGEMAVKYHTATHLLHAALRKVLGTHVEQRGSNITAERLRFDFSHTEKMTPEQIVAVEDLVNSAIKKDYPVHVAEMSVANAKAGGAMGLFADKYGEKVKVYSIGDPNQTPEAGIDSPTFSKEICGGPHVDHIGVLGKFKIKKEEASSAGIRRIKAILE